MQPVLLLLLLLLPLHIRAECVARLPTAENIGTSARVVNGLEAAPDDVDNVVTIAEDRDEGRDYFCMGSLIAPNWVVTAAQCFIRPGSNFVLHGGTSLTGTRYDIVQTVPHPGYLQIGQEVHRDDIQLIRLDRAVRDTLIPSPSPSPIPSGAPVSDPDSISEEQGPADEAPPDVNENFNFMYINNNTDFALDQPRYLRLKGYGITTQPQDSKVPLTLQTRTLRFADLRTSGCGDDFGNDDKRRICTEKDEECGPCFGDVGAPLYDVDRSGTFSVLVGIVTFGRESTSVEFPSCTGERPVAYTAVARYADWITETVRAQSEDDRLFFFQLPKEGITDTDLARDTSPLAIFAKTSVIVIACLALLGTIVTITVTCILRHMRKKRKRWLDGLQAEDSFVKAGEKEAIIVDPFEGIQEDQQPRFSLTGFSRAAVKGATDFSSRSIGLFKALVAREKDEEFLEAREGIDGAPVWVSTAWDKLFMAPSKKELQKIHTIPTQRVVDDVLSGAGKSVELSLQEVAYKAKRDEANLEAAWAKLEIQTSLRNMSEAASVASTANLFTPSRMSPSMSPLAGASPRKGSRNSSRIISRLGSDKRGPADLTKADTLLAAFASIDAESVQVAEETAIDSSALRALAEMKRPNVLATLRRKFSSGVGSPGPRSNDRRSEGRAESNSVLDSRGPGQLAASESRLGSGPNSHILTALSNASGIMTKGYLGSRQHSSMLMDYFSESYSVSSDSDEGEDHVAFEDIFEADHRRYTEDRKPQTEHESRSILGFRSMRKSQNRSFESLDRDRSSDSLSFANDTEDTERSSRLQRDLSDTTSKGHGHSSHAVSTFSGSSEKRPRSSASHSRSGPSTRTNEYTEFNWRDEDDIVVQMEDQPSLPPPSLLPDRADHRRSLQVSKTTLSPSANSGKVSRHDGLVSSSGNISVHMEEEITNANNDVRTAKPERIQNSLSPGVSSSHNSSLALSNETYEGSDYLAVVHMEEPSWSAKHATVESKRTVTTPTASSVSPTSNSTEEDMVSVYMEQDPSYATRVASKRKGDRAISAVDSFVGKRPTSKMVPPTIPPFRDGDTISVHMEDDSAPGPSVRSRITEFDESEKRARRLSEPTSARVRRESNVSVEKLKSMWNEIARRNSEDSYSS